MSSRSDFEFERWVQGQCSYRCGECGTTVGSSAHLWMHVRNVHAMKPAVFQFKHPEYCVRRSTHTCDICGETVDHDLGELMVHFKKHPGVSLKEYYQKYVAVEEVFKVQNTLNESLNENEEVPKVENSSSEPLDESLQEAGNVTTMPAKVEESNNERINGDSNHSIEDKGQIKSSAWFDGCLYKCRRCDFKCPTKSLIAPHVSAEH